MAATFEHSPVVSGSAIDRAERGFDGIVSRMRRFFRQRAEYNQIFRELSTLDDRNLADLGIARCDIPRIAREGALDV